MPSPSSFDRSSHSRAGDVVAYAPDVVNAALAADDPIAASDQVAATARPSTRFPSGGSS